MVNLLFLFCNYDENLTYFAFSDILCLILCHESLNITQTKTYILKISLSYTHNLNFCLKCHNLVEFIDKICYKIICIPMKINSGSIMPYSNLLMTSLHIQPITLLYIIVCHPKFVSCVTHTCLLYSCMGCCNQIEILYTLDCEKTCTSLKLSCIARCDGTIFSTITQLCIYILQHKRTNMILLNLNCSFHVLSLKIFWISGSLLHCVYCRRNTNLHLQFFQYDI